MNWIYEARASTILYNYLCSLDKEYEFLLPANICPIVPSVFLKAGVAFTLLDVNKTVLTIDQDLVENFLKTNNNLKGLLFVRTFGSMVDVNSWFNKLKKSYPDFRIIDDRCLCKPTFDESKFEDDIDITLFSTGYAKYVEFGKGGYAYAAADVFKKYQRLELPYTATEHDKIVKEFNRCISSRSFFHYIDSNWLDAEPLVEKFTNYRSRVLEQVEISNLQKTLINDVYLNEIPTSLWLGETFNDWRFSVLVADKTSLLNKIFQAGYFASSHYASMCGIFDGGKSVNADYSHGRIVNLFNDYRITKEQAFEISKIVKGHK